MSVKRPATSTNQQALAQLISDIAVVENFYNQPLPVSKTENSDVEKYNQDDEDLPPKVLAKISAFSSKPDSSRFFYDSTPDPVLRNSDNTLTPEGESNLRDRMKNPSVDIGQDDDVSLPSHQSSLYGYLQDLKAAVIAMRATGSEGISLGEESDQFSDTDSFASTSSDSSYSDSPPNSPPLSLPSAPESKKPSLSSATVSLKDVSHLPAFKKLEEAYRYRCSKEPASALKTHALLSELIVETHGRKDPDLINQYLKQMRQGTQHDYILKMLQDIHKTEMKNITRRIK